MWDYGMYDYIDFCRLFDITDARNGAFCRKSQKKRRLNKRRMGSRRKRR